MRNNKGYTLVELLIAMGIFGIVMLEIFNMMNNTSKLYLNGTYEIDLQAEAQQIVQQMEELMIDAEVSVSVNGAFNSDSVSQNGNYIEIINHDVTYKIEYEVVDSAVQDRFDESKTYQYGNIYLSAINSDGSSMANHELMGEYVECITMNMDEYESASKITLEFLLRNNMYSYNTSKDIYLRNDIGISGNRVPQASDDDYKYELEVLRYKSYNLSSLFNEDGNVYSYAILEGDHHVSVDSGSNYRINGGIGSSFTLETTNIFNSGGQWDSSAEAIIVALDDAGQEKFKIKIYTNPVSVGADGFGLFACDGNAAYQHRTPVRVEGVCLSEANITWQVDMDFDANTNFHPGPQTGDNVNITINGRATGGQEYEVRLDGSLNAQIDDSTNSIQFFAQNSMQTSGLFNLINAGGMLRLITTFEYDNGAVLTVYSYPYVTGVDMAEGLSNNYWNYCKSHTSSWPNPN